MSRARLIIQDLINDAGGLKPLSLASGLTVQQLSKLSSSDGLNLTRTTLPKLANALPDERRVELILAWLTDYLGDLSLLKDVFIGGNSLEEATTAYGRKLPEEGEAALEFLRKLMGRDPETMEFIVGFARQLGADIPSKR